VHPSPLGVSHGASGVIGRRIELHNVTMLDMIGITWHVDSEKIVGGPPWLDMERFDVVALPPAGVMPSEAQMETMLKALLASRFKLVVHNEKRPVSAFALTVEKSGVKMTRSSASGDPECKPAPPSDAQPRDTATSVTYTCRNMTMIAFADELPNLGGEYFWQTSVVDQTNLAGSWDFKLKWTPKWSLNGDDPDAVSTFEAADKQLGLKLILTNVPTDAIVVDSVNETPTPNPSGTADKLPRAPTAFDVADIKLSAPDEPRASAPPWLPAGLINLRIQHGGRVVVQTSTLKQMIMFAWNLPDNRILGAPTFADKDRFDITATTPADSASGQAPDIDADTVRVMMRTLLANRFKSAVHNQEETIDVYALIALKPKLQRADPAARSGCQNVPTTNHSAVQRLMTCQNITMAQFADELGPFAPGYLSPHPVVDATGINGGWDISLSFSGAGLVGPAASDTSGLNGAVSLFDALQEQLGLKLDIQKRPMPVIVIDHAEEPSPN
jgi:uncharacterized protein (TIGR03435 family)